jgi:thiosulfate/3-mercaptopyruvate sulfurtransferase
MMVSHRNYPVAVPFAMIGIVFAPYEQLGHAFTMLPASGSDLFGSRMSTLSNNYQLEQNGRRLTSCIASATMMDYPPIDDDYAYSPFPQLYGNTLVSVETIASLNKEQQQQHDALPTTSSKIIFVDGSWYHRPDPITNLPRNPSQDFISGPRLPSARYLDIDALATSHELFPADNPKKLPHMMPPPKLFCLAMDAYNIRNDDHVIVYARRGAFFTPRVWFLFHSMGHDIRRLHIMQGSLEDYVEVGGVVDTGEYHHSTTVMGERYIDCFDRGILNVTRLYQEYFTTTILRYSVGVPSAMNICNKDAVLEALSNVGDENKNTVIIDTRGSGYAKKGHMPNAIHLPYSQIATPTNALKIQPVSMLKKLFEDRGIDYLDPTMKIILSCGSGV